MNRKIENIHLFVIYTIYKEFLALNLNSNFISLLSVTFNILSNSKQSNSSRNNSNDSCFNRSYNRFDLQRGY